MKFWALSYSLPANPSRYRVAVWKALKDLGAVYLQPAVAVTPQRDGTRQALLDIKATVLAHDGTAALLSMEYDETADEEALLRSFRAAREEEYAGIADDAHRLSVQIDWEEQRGERMDGQTAKRYALECGRLRRRLAAAQTHDFFGAPGRENAADAVDLVAGRLPAADTKARPAKRRTETKKDARGTAKPAAPRPEPIPAPEPEPVREGSREMPVFLF